MRVMVIVKATADSENEKYPIDMEKNAEMFEQMGPTAMAIAAECDLTSPVSPRLSQADA